MGLRYREREATEEGKTVIEVSSTSHNGILTFNHIPLQYPSYEQRKNRRGEITETVNVNVRGQDIFHDGTWQKFLVSKGYINANLISLTKDTDRLMEEYYSFLVNEYTDRYHNLDSEGKAWIRRVIRLAVKYHIKENKLAGYKQSLGDEEDDTDYFYNKEALDLCILIDCMKVIKSETAGLIKHMVSEPEREDYYLEKVMNAHYKLLRQSSIPQRDNILHILRNTESKQIEGGEEAI